MKGSALEYRARRHQQRVDAARAAWPPCSPSSERCPSARRPDMHTNECCRACITAMLADVASALDAAGVRWWIDYGTLLGYMVNGGLYWNDKDTDLSVHAEERDKVLALFSQWREQGHTVTYAEPKPERFRCGDRVKVRLSEVNHANCDIFFWRPIESGLLDRINYIGVDRHKGREFPLDWALPATRGLWEGVSVAVPAEPLRLVEHRYGANWQNLPAARTDGVAR